jgi:hypothetical protein
MQRGEQIMHEIGNIDVNNLTRQITVQVSITGYKRLRVKMYLGRQLIRLGVWIMGMNCEIDIKE